MPKRRAKTSEKLIILIAIVIAALAIFVHFTINQDHHSIVGSWYGAPYNEDEGWRAQFAFDPDGSGAMMASSAETGLIFTWIDFFWIIERATPGQLHIASIDPGNPNESTIQYLEFEIFVDGDGAETLVMRGLGDAYPLYVLTRVE